MMAGTTGAPSSRMTMHGTLSDMEPEREPVALAPLPGQDELPSSDGVPMETARHRDQMNLLIDSLGAHWAHRDDFFVGGNMFVYFSARQIKRNDFLGPDVYVVRGTEKKDRKSWVAWDEGGKLPDVVIELLSESTEENDRGDKRTLYENVWKVGAYVLYDPWTHELEGYERVGGQLVPLVADEHGDLPIRELGLALGIRETKTHFNTCPLLRWIDRGVVVGSPIELAERAVAKLERAEAERARAETERARAETERARAEAERSAERARREEADRRIADLEARLAGR